MESQAILAAMAPELRLALAYATRTARPYFVGLFALDAKLSATVLTAREPMLAQIKLAWWREQIASPAGQRVTGVPVLEQLGRLPESGRFVLPLVDAWELALDDGLREDAATAGFAAAHAAVCAQLACLLGLSERQEQAALAGTCWALARAQCLIHPDIVKAGAAAGNLTGGQQRLDLGRQLRPLAILHGLARRSQGKRLLLSHPLDVLVAMRVGIFGI